MVTNFVNDMDRQLWTYFTEIELMREFNDKRTVIYS